jgi:hypothetical protein
VSQQSTRVGASAPQTATYGDVLLNLTPQSERHRIESEFTPKGPKGEGHEILSIPRRNNPFRFGGNEAIGFSGKNKTEGVLA